MSDNLPPSPATERSREAQDVAVVLLLLQAVLGLLSFLGLVAVAFLFPVLTPAGLIVLLGFALPLACAVGVARGWRWARRGAVIFQAVTLVSVGANLLIDLIPPVQMELTLSGLLSSFALPVSLIVLLRSPAVAPVPERRPSPAFPPPATVPDGGSRRQIPQGVI
jgi:hypothetical protein